MSWGQRGATSFGRWARGLAFLFVLIGVVGTRIDTGEAQAFNPPAISLAALPAAVVGESYSATLAASGGNPPYFWSVASGPIPGGLVLNSAGVLSGIPGKAGRNFLVLRVTDATGLATTASITLRILAAPSSSQALTIATSVGRIYSLSGNGPASSVLAGQEGVVAMAPAPGGADWIVSKTARIVVVGATSSRAVVRLPKPAGLVVAVAARAAVPGYWIATATGRVFGFGAARPLGNAHLSRREYLVAMASSPTRNGYWLLANDGTIEAFGGATAFGSPPHRTVAAAITSTPSGNGYWVVTTGGTVYAYGDATNLGSVQRSPHAPIVAIAAAPTGMGYWIVSSTGEVFNFGTARALGQVAGPHPIPTVVAAASSN